MDDILVHHGILGMKWGVRRFQNTDGTLTEAGKKRYSDDEKLIRSKRRTEKVSRVVKSINSSVQKTNNRIQNKKINLDKIDGESKSDYKTRKKSILDKENAVKSKYQSIADFSNQYGEAVSRIGKRRDERLGSEIAKEAKSFSDDELRKRVNRMNLEQQYRNLRRSDIDAGADIVYNRRLERAKDIVDLTAPIVTAIVAPIIVKKMTK